MQLDEVSSNYDRASHRFDAHAEAVEAGGIDSISLTRDSVLDVIQALTKA